MKRWHCRAYWKIYERWCVELDALEEDPTCDGLVILDKTQAMIEELEKHETSCTECED